MFGHNPYDFLKSKSETKSKGSEITLPPRKRQKTQHYLPPLAYKFQAMLGRGGRKAYEMDDEHRYYALIAQSAYQDEKERQGFMEKYVDGFSYSRHPKWSKDTLDVWTSAEEGGDRAIFSFRGTKNMEDVGTDAYIVAGNLKASERYEKDKEHTTKVMKELRERGVKHFDFVGHSLGGSIAVRLGEEFGSKMGDGKVHAYNPGSGLQEAVEHKRKGKNDSHINRYHIIGDVLSTLSGSKLDHHYTQACGVSNAHTITNFTGVGTTCEGKSSEKSVTEPEVATPEIKETPKSLV